MKLLTILTCFVLLLAAPAAHGIQSDQIRGEIVAVDASERSLTVKITESGSNIETAEGTTKTYHVPRDVPIEYDIDTRRYSVYDNFDFADIRAGDRVLMDFDLLQDTDTVISFRNEETLNVAARDRIRTEGRLVDNDDFNESDQRMAYNDSSNQRSSLPDSASGLPMFALLGLLFAGLAGAVRLTRS